MSIRRTIGFLVLAAFAAMVAYGLIFQQVHVKSAAGSAAGSRDIKGSSIVTESVAQTILLAPDGQIVGSTNKITKSTPGCPT